MHISSAARETGPSLFIGTSKAQRENIKVDPQFSLRLPKGFGQFGTDKEQAWDSYTTFTENGSMTEELFFWLCTELIPTMYPDMAPRAGFYVFFLVDGGPGRISARLTRWGLKNGLILFPNWPHGTAVAQALDQLYGAYSLQCTANLMLIIGRRIAASAEADSKRVWGGAVMKRHYFRAWQGVVHPAAAAKASKQLSSPLFGFVPGKASVTVTMNDLPDIINWFPYRDNETEEELKRHAFDYYLKGKHYQDMAWCATGQAWPFTRAALQDEKVQPDVIGTDESRVISSLVVKHQGNLDAARAKGLNVSPMDVVPPSLSHVKTAKGWLHKSEPTAV
jgi:hypothetical protein